MIDEFLKKVETHLGLKNQLRDCNCHGPVYQEKTIGKIWINIFGGDEVG